MKTLEELRARLEEVRSRLRELDAEHTGEIIEPESDQGQEWARLEDEQKELVRTVEQLDRRTAYLEEISREESEAQVEAGATFQTPRPGVARGADIYDLTTVRSSVADPASAGMEMRDRALRSLDAASFQHPQAQASAGSIKTHVEGLLHRDTEDGRFARYLLSCGSPLYSRAFGKYLANRERSREETAALWQAQESERALSLTGASGGFAVPYELDPTILLTSNGVINPIRDVARVEQITVDEWRGITSAGVTAAYQAEATEVADTSPTLAQPTVSTEKAQAFIQFSIEIGQDWTGLQQQMAMLLQEARDILEAQKFATGTGTNEPFGVLTGTTNTVNATTGQAFDLEDLYRLRSALPPRFRAEAVFMGDLGILDRIRQFDTVGSSAAIWQDSLQLNTPANLLGRRVYEASEFPDTPATGNKFLVYGDFTKYLIVDRVGLTVEQVPHVFGANRRPTGERGIYAYWRNSGKVIVAEAFRALLGIV